MINEEEEEEKKVRWMVVVASGEEEGKRQKIKVAVAGWSQVRSRVEKAVTGGEEREWWCVDPQLSKRVPLQSDQQLRQLLESSEKYACADEDGEPLRFHPAVRLYASPPILWQPAGERWRTLRQMLLESNGESEDASRALQEWVDDPQEDHSASDEDGGTLLHLAMACDLPNVVRLLATGKVAAMLQDRAGLSPLHVAVLANNASAVDALLTSLSPQAALSALLQPVGKSSSTRLVSLAVKGTLPADLPAPSSPMAHLLASHLVKLSPIITPQRPASSSND